MVKSTRNKSSYSSKIEPNRKEQIECDYHHYKERHAIECLFGKLKHYRRIATRYEKKAINYMGMLSSASVRLWLR
ncbi:MAG: transposase [Methylococcales bacterium]|nr:transposase [Methylococcales bacterium]